MSAKRKPVELFVSYSHRDRKHLDLLRTHLAGLERENRVRCWWDGALEVGKGWEGQIQEALHRAEIVILLLTANFVASDFCVEQELRSARERERQGQIDVIPILVDDFDLGSHWLGQLQSITVKGKSIVRSRLGAAAWESVARQVRLKVECIEGKRPVMQALNDVEEVVHSGELGLGDLPSRPRVGAAAFPTVSAFWRSEPDLLQELEIVTVEGTLSRFAPMLMGPPRAKRVLHREFRKAIEVHRRFGERKRLTINACMSISAGQMVHRGVRKGQRKRLLGLYESIVRNALPIFVLSDYYERELAPLLRDTAGRECFEAAVTGRLFQLDNNYIRRILAQKSLDRILPAQVIDDLCKDAYALEVGSRGTGVRQLQGHPVRYLDGDIWLAAESEGSERFYTAFVDIADRAERDEEMAKLRQEAGKNRIIVAYDELQSIEELLDGDDG